MALNVIVKKDEKKRVSPDTKRLFAEPSDLIMLNGKIPIPRFDLTSLNPQMEGYRAMILGASGTGKSNLLCTAMYELQHLIDVWTVINSSESASKKYSPFLPTEASVWEPEDNDFETAAQQINKCLKAVRARSQKIARKWAIPDTQPIRYKHPISQVLVGDDIASDKRVFNDPVWSWMLKVSRNYLVLLFLIIQNAKDIAPDRRKQFSHIFSSKCSNLKDMQDLYQQFFSVFGSGKEGYKDFENAFNLCTTPTVTGDPDNPRFRFIVCINQSPSNKIEDKIAWIECGGSWRLPPFTVGAPWWQKQVKKHFDPNWKDPEVIERKMEKIQNEIIAQKAMEKAIKKGIKIGGKPEPPPDKYVLIGEENEYEE